MMILGKYKARNDTYILLHSCKQLISLSYRLGTIKGFSLDFITQNATRGDRTGQALIPVNQHRKDDLLGCNQLILISNGSSSMY